MLTAESLPAHAVDAPIEREEACQRTDLVGVATEFEGPGAITAMAATGALSVLFWTAFFAWVLS